MPTCSALATGKMQTNGTLREIAGRITEFRARTGRDLGAIWISQDRFALLPQELRERAPGGRFSLDNIPVRVIEVLSPAGR